MMRMNTRDRNQLALSMSQNLTLGKDNPLQRSILKTKKEMYKLKNLQSEGNASDEDADMENDEKYTAKLVQCVQLPKFILTEEQFSSITVPQVSL